MLTVVHSIFSRRLWFITLRFSGPDRMDNLIGTSHLEGYLAGELPVSGCVCLPTDGSEITA